MCVFYVMQWLKRKINDIQNENNNNNNNICMFRFTM